MVNWKKETAGKIGRKGLYKDSKDICLEVSHLGDMKWHQSFKLFYVHFLFSDLCYTEASSFLALASQILEHLSSKLGNKVQLRIWQQRKALAALPMSHMGGGSSEKIFIGFQVKLFQKVDDALGKKKETFLHLSVKIE